MLAMGGNRGETNDCIYTLFLFKNTASSKHNSPTLKLNSSMSLTSPPTHNSLEKSKMAAHDHPTTNDVIEEVHHDASSTKMTEEVDFVPDPKFERKLIRKIDLLTVPMMILIYFLS